MSLLTRGGPALGRRVDRSGGPGPRSVVVDPTGVGLLLAGLVGIGLRARAFTSGRSLWLDEVLLALNIRDRDLISLLVEPMEGLQSAPPGYLILARGAVAVLGPTDAAARSVALVAGIGSVLLGIRYARLALVNGFARLGFAWSIALSPTLIYYSHEVKQYSSDSLATLMVLVAWRSRHRWSGPALAAVAAVAALLSLPGLLATGVLVLGLVAEHLRDRSARARRRLNGVLMFWGIAAALHVSHGLTVGGDRDYLRAWWSMKAGFPPLPPWERSDVSWFVTTTSRTIWLALGHEGRAFPSMDRGPLLATGLVVLLSVVAMIQQRRDALRDLGLPIAIVGVTVLASFARLYPLSSRLVVFLVPAVLAIHFGSVDRLLVRWRGDSMLVRIRRAALALTVIGLIATTLPSTIGRAVRPLDDRDAREAVIRIEEWPAPAVVVAFEPGIIDWYAAQLPAAHLKFPVVGPTMLEALVSDVEGGGVASVWIVSSQSTAEAMSDLTEVGVQRLSCLFVEDETVLALVVDPRSVPDDASRWCDLGSPVGAAADLEQPPAP